MREVDANRCKITGNRTKLKIPLHEDGHRFPHPVVQCMEVIKINIVRELLVTNPPNDVV